MSSRSIQTRIYIYSLRHGENGVPLDSKKECRTLWLLQRRNGAYPLTAGGSR